MLVEPLGGVLLGLTMTGYAVRDALSQVQTKTDADTQRFNSAGYTNCWGHVEWSRRSNNTCSSSCETNK